MPKSIIQADCERCYLCGGYGTSIDPLDRHHVFFGPLRKKSERYGLTVYLHHGKCHIFGKRAVHVDAEVCRKLQEEVQRIAMEYYGWTAEEFRLKVGKNCL